MQGCGATLIFARSKVKHGEWGDWIKANCKFGWRRSQQYIKLFERKYAIDGDSLFDISLMVTANAFERENPKIVEAEKLELDWDDPARIAPAGVKSETVSHLPPKGVSPEADPQDQGSSEGAGVGEASSETCSFSAQRTKD